MQPSAVPRPGRPVPPTGLFVTFEGGEGAGKSTQVARLKERLAARGLGVLVTREPGGSPRAEAIRRILLAGHAKPFGATTEAMLFAAARANHVERTIMPALRAGVAVLCDRFGDSTHVYQGMGAGVPSRVLERFDAASTGRLRPDVTIVLDIAAERGLARAGRRRSAEGEAIDRFEREGTAFHARVRRAFLAIAAAEPERCVVVDADRPPDAVERDIWDAVAAPARGGEGAWRLISTDFRIRGSATTSSGIRTPCKPFSTRRRAAASTMPG